MDQNLAALQTILQLGWPGIVLVECIILWRDNQSLRQQLIDVLREQRKPVVPEPPSIIYSGND